MVYHGVVSRGCERCRQRKIKCDQRRPACSRCEKSKTTCPGYRDLSKVIFRDESSKIIRKAELRESPRLALEQVTMQAIETIPSIKSGWIANPNYYLIESHIPRLHNSLSQPIQELAANFFFAKYTFEETPFAGEYHDWLVRSYSSGYGVLCAVIEAVGMAGISNVSDAPNIMDESNKRYCTALAATKRALDSPTEAVADSTLMAVILLGLFETVNFENVDRYGYWEAHVRGAMSLLELRGNEQFTQKRGGLLYVMIRSQILMMCMHQNMYIPPALLQTAHGFQTSSIRRDLQRENVASPDSISEISFRIVNLRTAINTGDITEINEIPQRAFQVDDDLIAWKATASHDWMCCTVDSTEVTGSKKDFNGKRHIYPSLWIAEIWNNWRVLRILTNQFIFTHSSTEDLSQTSAALSIILEMSTDICTSVSSFTNTPRLLSLIRPLFVVAQEEMNAESLRRFAAEQLQRIGAELGIRQAILLADTVVKSLNEAKKGHITSGRCCKIPLVPFF